MALLPLYGWNSHIMAEDRENTGESHFEVPDAELVASPATLPCGRTLRNRLVKVCFSRRHLSS